MSTGTILGYIVLKEYKLAIRQPLLVLNLRRSFDLPKKLRKALRGKMNTPSMKEGSIAFHRGGISLKSKISARSAQEIRPEMEEIPLVFGKFADGSKIWG